MTRFWRSFPLWLPAFFGLLFLLALFSSDGGWVLYIPLMTGLALWGALSMSAGQTSLSCRTAPAIGAGLSMGGLLIATLLWSPSKQLSLYELQTYVMAAAAMFLTATLRVPVLRACLLACAPALLYMAGYGAYQWAVSGQMARAHFDDSNLYAGLLFSAGCAYFGLAWDARTAAKRVGAHAWPGLLGCALMVAGVLSHSRGAMAALCLALFVTLWLVRQHFGLKRRHIGALALVLAAIGGGSSAWKTASDLGQHQGLGASFNSRLAMWQSTAHMIAEHPVRGVGLGLWHLAYPRYRSALDTDSAGFRAHNDYLEAWATAGLLGLLASLCAPILWLRSVFRARQELPLSPGLFVGLTVGAGTLMFQALVNFVYHQSAVCLFSGVLLGGMYALQAPLERVRTRPRWRVRVALALLVAATFCGTSLLYITMAPTLAIANAASFEGKHMAWTLDDDTLLLIAKLNPFGSGPYFALGHKAQVAAYRETSAVKRQADLKRALYFYGLAEQREPVQESLAVRMGLIVEAYPGLPAPLRDKMAEAEYQRAVSLNPADYGVLKAYVELLRRQKRFAEARALVSAGMAHASVYRQRGLATLLSAMK